MGSVKKLKIVELTIIKREYEYIDNFLLEENRELICESKQIFYDDVNPFNDTLNEKDVVEMIRMHHFVRVTNHTVHTHNCKHHNKKKK